MYSLIMYDGVDFSVLLDFWSETGHEIRALWGNSATEVFVAVHDYYNPRPDCGIEYLLWYDGTEFHWF